MSAVRPSPDDFDDYRAYLRAMIDYLKATKKGFTFRKFSKDAGYSSPNFLKLVADGKRGLSQTSISRFAKALGLSAAEHDVFETLVLLGQAESDEAKNRQIDKLKKRRGQRSASKELEITQYEAYTYWYVIPIREMMLWPEFQEDANWIANTMRPRIKPAEASRALEILLRLGLAERNASGKLTPVDKDVRTPGLVRSLGIRNYHRSILNQAAHSIDTLDPTQRDITSLTASMSEARYKEVTQRIQRFRSELLDAIEAPDNAPGRRVYALSFSVCPVTAASDEECESS